MRARAVLFVAVSIASLVGCHGDKVGDYPEDALADSSDASDADTRSDGDAVSTDTTDTADTADSEIDSKLDSPVDSATDTSVDSSSDSPVDSSIETCSDTPGSTGCGTLSATVQPMINLGSFCIDETEVTRREYGVFVTVPTASFTFTPKCGASHDYNAAFVDSKFTGPDDHPVVGITWCEAYDFCQWAGKRLCGKIGGGSEVESSFASTSDDQWMYACSHHGDVTWPYGNTYSDTACNGATSDHAIAVGSLCSCQGGFPGIFDMSGNVGEWEDCCDGAGTTCHIRGDYFGIGEAAADLACNGSRSDVVTARWSNVGFRCCSK